MNIEETDKKVQQIDRLLTSITKLIKKHWKIMLLILVVIMGYVYFRQSIGEPTILTAPTKSIIDTIKVTEVTEIIDTVKVYPSDSTTQQ